MPKFFYIVRDRLGKKITGIQEAITQEEAINTLQSKGFVVVNIIPEKQEDKANASIVASGRGRFVSKHNKITGDDLVIFCRQLATLIGAGITILRSLNIISQQVASKRLHQIIQELEKHMEAGLSLHEAIAKYPTVFSPLWTNLIESGEASGNLSLVLNRLAGYLERNAAFRKKIVSALIYPAILMVTGLGALLFMTIKIIPTFAEIFTGFNVELPFLTKMLLLTSFYIRKFGIIIVVTIGIIFWFLRRYVKTREGKRAFQLFLLKLPIVSDFFRNISIERFTSEMFTLIESGVPILYSLEISERSVDNVILGDIIRKVKEEVREGKLLGQSLEKSGFFDPMVSQMISIGEEVGELPGMFKKLNAFYQEHLEVFTTRFTSIFEPVMLIFMGVVIGIMIIGLFLPIFKISQISGG
jgi:type IV pilus assembly protein PilC